MIARAREERKKKKELEIAVHKSVDLIPPDVKASYKQMATKLRKAIRELSSSASADTTQRKSGGSPLSKKQQMAKRKREIAEDEKQRRAELQARIEHAQKTRPFLVERGFFFSRFFSVLLTIPYRTAARDMAKEAEQARLDAIFRRAKYEDDEADTLQQQLSSLAGQKKKLIQQQSRKENIHDLLSRVNQELGGGTTVSAAAAPAPLVVSRPIKNLQDVYSNASSDHFEEDDDDE